MRHRVWWQHEIVESDRGLDSPRQPFQASRILGARAGLELVFVEWHFPSVGLHSGSSRRAVYLLRRQPECGHGVSQVEAWWCIAVEIPPPEVGPLQRIRHRRLADERHVACPGRVPTPGTDEHHQRWHFRESANRWQTFREQHLHRAGDNTRAGQARLTRCEGRDHRRIIIRAQSLEVQRESGTADLRESARSQRRAGGAGSLVNVGKSAPTLPFSRGRGVWGGVAHPADELRRLFGRRLLPLVRKRCHHRVADVAPEQVRRHTVGDPNRSCQYWPFALFDQHQVLVDERRAGGESAAGVGAARGQPAQLEAQSDAGPPAGNVVLQISIESLEAGVNIGRHRNQQQLDVDLIQAEVASQAAQAQIGPFLLGGVRRGFDFLSCLRGRWVRSGGG